MSAPATHPEVDSNDRQQERAAVERLLASGIFDRAPSLATFLRYVCTKHFDGRPDQIKEYNIAVDALGRGPEFDQKRDSIVRVEAHRLRKRLQEYYRTAGAGEPVQVSIPPGSYAPRFVHLAEQPVELAASEQTGAEVSAEEATGELIAASPPARVIAVPPLRTKRRLAVWALLSFFVLVLVGLTGWWMFRRPEPAQRVTPPPVAAAPFGDEIRILAGFDEPRYVDRLGNVWGKDRFFIGGSTMSVPPRAIRRTLDPSLYLRQRLGKFRYDIPLKEGVYELRLHFAETIFGEGNVAGGGESSRVFAVRINGGEPFVADIISDASGSNTADIRVFKDVRPGRDGMIHVEFYPFQKEQAFVNAIEVIPAQAGKILPVRIAARPTPFTDRARHEWGPDRHFEGGVQVVRYDDIRGVENPELFQCERFGNFRYVIPVSPGGQYTATMRFCENWFGPGRPGGGGQGSRIFDIYCNGRALVRQLDVFKRAGGALRPVVETFRGLEPNAQGKLIFEFVPLENYALVNTIEVIAEDR